MSKELVCPFCNSKLSDVSLDYDWKCEKCSLAADLEVWQELIRTRKALDILLLTINRLEKQNYKDCAWHLRLAIAKIKATDIANKALDQITALEQKDVK